MELDPSRLDYFDYDLPSEAIAQTPCEPRDAASLLVDIDSGAVSHQPHDFAAVDAVVDGVVDSKVAELASHLRRGDLVVVNNTRVLAARLLLTKETGGNVEVFLLEQTGQPQQWRAMIRPGKRVAPDTELYFEGSAIVRAGERLDDGLRFVTLLDDSAIDKAGNVPLPPYITTELKDADRYQTMFADRLGSVAAPTAGLHFTPQVCESLNDAGVEVETVELQVGLGTFRPIMTDKIADHKMHSETYCIEADTWQKIQRHKRQGGRIVAVGTTVVRTLESAAATGELEGSTELFIDRSFDWRVVDMLLTNFHMPRSSLLVLVDSFRPARWRELYEHALASGYRFLSFGDAMLIERTSGSES